MGKYILLGTGDFFSLRRRDSNIFLNMLYAALSTITLNTFVDVVLHTPLSYKDRSLKINRRQSSKLPFREPFSRLLTRPSQDRVITNPGINHSTFSQ